MFKANLEKGYDWDGYDLRIIRDNHEGRSKVTSFILESYEEGEVIDPVMRGEITKQFVQAIMDAGFDAGMMPTQVEDTTYMKAHLKDMREISRHLLKMEK